MRESRSKFRFTGGESSVYGNLDSSRSRIFTMCEQICVHMHDDDDDDEGDEDGARNV